MITKLSEIQTILNTLPLMPISFAMVSALVGCLLGKLQKLVLPVMTAEGP